MSKLQYDQILDEDEEEVCPLCVEELDLSDKSFFPCPCHYQVCIFCAASLKVKLTTFCRSANFATTTSRTI